MSLRLRRRCSLRCCRSRRRLQVLRWLRAQLDTYGFRRGLLGLQMLFSLRLREWLGRKMSLLMLEVALLYLYLVRRLLARRITGRRARGMRGISWLRFSTHMLIEI